MNSETIRKIRLGQDADLSEDDMVALSCLLKQATEFEIPWYNARAVNVNGVIEYVELDHQIIVVQDKKRKQPKYQVVDGELGRGGIGKVYQTTRYFQHDDSGKLLMRYNQKAKALKRNFVTTSPYPEIESEQKFMAEMVSGVRLTQLLDAQSQKEISLAKQIYLSMPILGRSARRMQRKDSYNSLQRFQTVSQTARLLADFHERVQHIHRDIKPENICIDVTGKVSLIDYGIALPFGPTKEIGGTPGYLAPELFEDGDVEMNASIDIYALGVTAAEILGCKPGDIGILPEPEVRWRPCRISQDQLIHVKQSNRVAAKKFLESMVAKDSAARPQLKTCAAFFDYLKDDPHPRQLIQQALEAEDKDFADLPLKKVVELKQAVAILTRPDLFQSEHQALEYFFTPEQLESAKDVLLKVLPSYPGEAVDEAQNSMKKKVKAGGETLIRKLQQLKSDLFEGVPDQIAENDANLFSSIITRFEKCLRGELDSLSGLTNHIGDQVEVIFKLLNYFEELEDLPNMTEGRMAALSGEFLDQFYDIVQSYRRVCMVNIGDWTRKAFQPPSENTPRVSS